MSESETKKEQVKNDEKEEVKPEELVCFVDNILNSS